MSLGRLFHRSSFTSGLEYGDSADPQRVRVLQLSEGLRLRRFCQLETNERSHTALFSDCLGAFPHSVKPSISLCGISDLLLSNLVLRYSPSG